MTRSLAGVVLLLLAGPALAQAGIWREPLTGMPFVRLTKGCFQMGTKRPLPPVEALELTHSAYKASLSADEQPKHEVCVDAFLIGQYEVRADDWIKVMGEPPPAGRGDAPAAGISWVAAQEFARRLTQQSAGKQRFRLPTEAEWEYACRAGTKKDIVPNMADHADVAHYSVADETYLEQPAAVGKLKPNARGLHDMLGNVWEWVEDGYRPDAYARHTLYNPVVKYASAARPRVIRGGSHRSEFYHVRCANRGWYAADAALGHIGLRLVRQP
jgi:formylglycine-generating enzyme required for sulfatase activity